MTRNASVRASEHQVGLLRKEGSFTGKSRAIYILLDMCTNWNVIFCDFLFCLFHTLDDLTFVPPSAIVLLISVFSVSDCVTISVRYCGVFFSLAILF